MKIEKYGEGRHKRRKRFLFVLIAIVFLGIVVGLIYYAYAGSIPLTGNFVGSQTPKNPVSLLADLNAPNQVIALDSGIGSIELVVSRGIPGNFLHVGKQKVNLGDSKDSEIIINGFSGKISFDGRSILYLNGKASEVIVNGVKTTPQAGESMKVSIDEDFAYSYLKMQQVFIDRLSYVASGEIKINEGKAGIELDKEEFTLTGFLGNLEMKKGKLGLDGMSERVSVTGILDLKAG